MPKDTLPGIMKCGEGCDKGAGSLTLPLYVKEEVHNAMGAPSVQDLLEWNGTAKNPHLSRKGQEDYEA